MRTGLIVVAVLAALGAAAVLDDKSKETSSGVLIQQDELPKLQGELAKTISALPTKAMKKTGLAGVMGDGQKGSGVVSA